MNVGANLSQQWDDLKKKTLEALRPYFHGGPEDRLESRTKKVVLHSLVVDESRAQDGDLKGQELAKENDQTWGARVMADVSLVDKASGKELSRGKVKLLTLPKPTERFTYIVGGNEAQIHSLWKLKSGVYAHVQENGEHKTEFNLAKKFAGASRLNILLGSDEANKGKFQLSYNTAKVPLYPVLRALGVSDDEMKQTWGKDVYERNLVRDPDKALLSFYSRLRIPGLEKNVSPKDAAKKLIEEFGKTELRADSTKAVFGKPLEKVNGEALLLGAHRILEVFRGNIPPDNRDSLLFKSLHGVDDYVHQYLSRPPTKAKVKGRVIAALNKVDEALRNKEPVHVSNVLGGGPFDEFVKTFFGKSSLAAKPDQTNPLETMANFRTTTTLGGDVGGIKSEQTLTRPMKLIDPSHMGFLDVNHTPEGSRTGITLRLPLAAKKVGNEVKIRVYDLKTRKQVEVSPNEMHAEPVVLPDQVKWGKDGHPIARVPEVKLKDPKTNDIITAPLSKGRYVMLSPLQMFDEVSNLIPFLSSNQGNRASMAAKIMEQAISLKHREEPLVQVAAGEGMASLEKVIGQPWSRRSPVDGVVQKIVHSATNGHPEELHVKGADGKLHKVPLYNHFPLNDKESFLHSELHVKPGDKVSKGALLADSNFTRQGTLSLGTNLKVAYLPAYYNYNDGIVISESAAKKLTSNHVHRVTLELGERDEVGKKAFSVHAGATAKKVGGLDKVHDDGVIPVGTKVQQGDLLVAAIGKAQLDIDTADQIKRAMSKKADRSKLAVTSRALVWDGEHPGEVVKVVRPPNGKTITVYVRTEEPAQLGDKLAGRHANKCFDPETEVLTRRGWVPVAEVGMQDEVLSLDRTTLVPHWVKPTATITLVHEGDMVKIQGPTLDLLVTPNHRHFVEEFGKAVPGLVSAEDCLGKSVRHVARGNPAPVRGAEELFTLPGVPHERWARYLDSVDISIPMMDLGRVLAAFLRGGGVGDGVVELPGDGGDALAASAARAGRIIYRTRNRVAVRSPHLAAYLETLVPTGFAPKPQIPVAERLRDLDASGARTFVTGLLGAPIGQDVADAAQALACEHALLPVIVNPLPDGRAFLSEGRPRVPSQDAHTQESLVPYDGKVHCLEVPGHVLCVRRHGKAIFSGNSIITQILPDHEMPRVGGPTGEPVHVLINPSGVPTRINDGQIFETAAAKIAEKTGKPYAIHNFTGPDTDNHARVKKDLAAHGLTDQEPLYDPKTKHKLGDVLVGPQYLLKLKHVIDHKLFYRGIGSESAGYTLDHQPTGTGSGRPGQGLGGLELYSLLAHGARHTLREMMTYKSDSQVGPTNNTADHTKFWTDVIAGGMPAPPQVPFVYRKFEALLKGAGIQMQKDGSSLKLLPFTDADVKALAAGPLKDAGRGSVRTKNMKEMVNGLFDPKVTGGLPNRAGAGLNWSYIPLPEPFPHPTFVGTKQRPGPAVVLTGLKFDEFEQVARGKKMIGGETGGKAIEKMLKAVDVKKETEALRAKLPSLRGQALDQANRKLKFLFALHDLGKRPEEVYIQRAVPVLPPVFRPMTQLPDGSLRFDDSNLYYRQIAVLAKELQEFHKDAPESRKTNLRTQLYDHLRGFVGLHDKDSARLYDGSRKVKGILDIIRGGEDAGPKTGFFLNQMVRRRQDMSMRSTIVPEPKLALDEVGLPRDAAAEIYSPLVARHLVTQMGYAPAEAKKALRDKTPAAMTALDKVMAERPVLMKRDPVLHAYGIMAFKPKVVDGKAIRIHPLVTGPFGADFDGDTMSVFVPFTNEAVREAHKMFPSNHLFNSTNYAVQYTPDQEMIFGLHLMSRWGKETKHSFKDFAAAKAAEAAGTIRANDVVTVAGKRTTLGRLLLADALPPAMRDKHLGDMLQHPKFELVQKPGNPAEMAHGKLFERIAKEHPKDYPVVINKLKDLGNHYAYSLGASVGMKDLEVPKDLRQKTLAPFDRKAAQIQALKIPEAEKRQKLVEVYTEANKELEKAVLGHLEKHDNAFFRWYKSGARGKKEQVMQMLAAPMLMQDAKGRILPHPVRRSYSEGLDLGDYWTAMHGARSGTLGRAEESSKPGASTKNVINTVMSALIESHDCGTNQGIHLEVQDPDVQDRFLAAPVRLGTKTVHAGTVVDPSLLAELRKHKVDKVVVRSPLKCAHGAGICAKCYGLSQHGRPHDLGTNIGVIAGQAMGEPMTNLAMKSFHSGGVASGAGARATSTFDAIKATLEMPRSNPDPAILSRAHGKVERIERDKGLNGHNVIIGGTAHFVPSGKTLLHNGRKPLALGDEVRKGDSLSSGIVNPHELLELTDIHRVQQHLVDDLSKNIYKDATRRRNIETVIRSTTNLTRVVDPGSSPFLHGDVMQRTAIEEYNRGLKPGEKPVQHKPMLKYLQETALEQHTDFMARLGYRKQKNTLLEGVAQGWTSDLHGRHPIPALVHGKEFGLGKPGKPHHY